ncbi:hypothetical protein SAMN05421749_103277 [Acinetobacter marinus]|uniref:DUF7167 domain-containing protein n=1 Tax=Acinetobacter marinus TaxID=281375 RepID=A0A1G6J8G0_9GAMM|nr:hypothetical protein [Acinetobacter marinus]SDC15134.1 hypothetical protein SAMN05421749_103277 [Acinetobacter marinus]
MSKFNSIKIKLYLGIGFPGAVHEEDVFLHEYISESEWNKLNATEKEEFLHEEIFREWVSGYLDQSVSIYDEEAE